MARAALLSLAIAALLLGGCGGSDSSSSSSTTATTAASGQPERGEASIEGFGAEAQGSYRAEVLAVFHAYLGAIAAKDYAIACSYLSARVRKSLEQLTRAKQPCPKALPVIFSPTAAATAASQNGGTVTKVRTKGNEGFVIYKAPGAKRYELTMAREGGQWKAAAAIGAVLVPEFGE